MSAILTVSQINRYLASKIRGDMKLKSIAVKGEVSNLNMNYSSGHIYFTLKDENSSLRAVMFASSAGNLRFELQNGANIMALGNIDCYERDGVYQIIVTDIQPIGVGAVKESLEKLKEKLNKKGYFSSSLKKQIPYAPKTIGVVTSLTGAAVQDILNVLKRRYPICKALIFPTSVQGAEAAENISDSVRLADSMNLDTIILARGGGSAEDLSVFNSERVADAIFQSKTPVISAIGHETDVTIADLVADLRAPTPSAAAELASPDISDYYLLIKSLRSRLDKTAENEILNLETKLKAVYEKLMSSSPEKRLQIDEIKLNNAEYKLRSTFKNRLNEYTASLKSAASLLDSYSPLKVLSRGYSLTTKNGRVVTRADEISQGEEFKIQFSDSSINAVAVKINN